MFLTFVQLFYFLQICESVKCIVFYSVRCSRPVGTVLKLRKHAFYIKISDVIQTQNHYKFHYVIIILIFLIFNCVFRFLTVRNVYRIYNHEEFFLSVNVFCVKGVNCIQSVDMFDKCFDSSNIFLKRGKDYRKIATKKTNEIVHTYDFENSKQR